MARYVALSGTPGTGKSAVAKRLRPEGRAVEIADLALRTGTGTGRGRTVTIDLAALGRWIERHPADRTTVVVGHLAHLLPIREVILLRCRPRELARRLARARRGSPRDRAENVAAEAIDLVLSEAQRLGRSVHEVDTTGRSVRSVAEEVARILARPWRARYGRIDWLSDPTTTDGLLRRAP